jgi:hypothetical protein
MQIVKHRVLKSMQGYNEVVTHKVISLPFVPGVTLTPDRNETTPIQPTIRIKRPKRQTAYDILMDAMRAVREDA